MKIRICEHNPGALQLFQRLQASYPDLNIKLKKCVKHCKICKKQPFVLVAKQPVFASDTEQLYGDIVSLFDQGKHA